MCKDKDSLEQALRVAKSPPPEDFWKDGKLIKFFKKLKKLTKRTFSQITFQDGFIRDRLQANTHPLNRHCWVSLGRNGAVRATGSLPAQPDLSCLTWADPAWGQRKSLQPTHSGQEKEVKKKRVFLLFSIVDPTEHSHVVIPRLPITARGTGGSGGPQGERGKRHVHVSKTQEKPIMQQRGE